jgi:ribose transport system substrate-binding protein
MKQWLVGALVLVVSGLFGGDLVLLGVPKSQDQEFWVAVRKGVQRAVDQDGGARLIWRGPAYNNDTDQQIAIVAHYLEHPEVNGILLCPTDQDRLVPSVQAARAQGIPVLIFDSQLAGASDGYVATDNRAGGASVAGVLVRTPSAPRKVVILRTVKGSASTEERAEGFRKVLGQAGPVWSVVEDLWGGGSQGDLTRAAVALVKRWGNTVSYFAVNESATLGLLNALELAKIRQPAFAWGFDSTADIEAAVASGQLTGTSVQDTERMGYEAAHRLLEVLRGRPPTSPVLLLGTVIHGRPAGESGPKKP